MLQHRVGEIFYLRYIYGSDFNVKRWNDTTKTYDTVNIKGETIFGANTIAGYENEAYTKDLHEAEAQLSVTGLGGTSFEGVIDYAPLQFETLTLRVTDATNGDVEIVDDGKGNLLYTGRSVTKPTKCGNVVYSTGAYTVFLATDATATIEADYSSSFEDANNEADGAANENMNRIPQIELTVDSVFIQAKPRKLRANYTLDAGYDLQQAQGIDIKDALLQAAAMQLKNEVDGELIATAYNGAYSKTTWSMLQPNVDPHISRKDYYELFIEHIFQQCSAIRQETKRVTGNWMVCGKKAADILQFIGAPRFVGNAATSAEVGPFYAGTLDGRIKVYVDPFLAENQYLIGYKGNNLIDAGLVYAPYLLFFATETIMLDDFLGRRGFCTMYGKKMINNKFYIAGTIV